MKVFSFALVIALLVVIASVNADVYLHNPRGSNDRLNEVNQNRQNANRVYDSQDNAAGGYSYGPPMYFMVGSELNLEWTSQHSCNTPKVRCQVIFQYMCDADAPGMRDGTTTDTVPDDATTSQDTKYGRQETYQYYQDCKARERNKGLYTADQNLGDSARSTRQNPGGARSGFECPEERDYYPYWHPNPWRDIAVLTDNTTMCAYYQKESQNVLGKSFCSKNQYNNEASCKQNGGEFKLADAKGLPAPECIAAPRSRDNHLGNGDAMEMNAYKWTVPDMVSDACVLRIRYNISTTDVDFWNASVNAALSKANSPLKQDPMPDYGGKNLSLALNTNQYGRTFQDRTFMFKIKKRPDGIDTKARIVNLNIRGKRGNIVQTYPAVEYDFTPNRLLVTPNDYIHIQWTGSDFNANNGNNNAEGTDATDRNNMVQIEDLGKNVPLAWAKRATLKGTNKLLFEDDAAAMKFAHLDQQGCKTYEELLAANNNDNNAVEKAKENCMKLNAASQYFDGGLQKFNATGQFHFMSTRNNNFSNRSQKGSIVVVPSVDSWVWAATGVGIGSAAVGVASLITWKKGLFVFASAAA